MTACTTESTAVLDRRVDDLLLHASVCADGSSKHSAGTDL